MISWANYHSHTHYCDGAEAPEEYIKEAIKLGMPAYGYSSHAPLPFYSSWNISNEQLKNYLSEITNIKTKYRSQIQVYMGMEIDFIPGIAGRSKHLMKNTDLDYFIGSVHFLEHFPDGTYWNIDTSHELFVRGLREIFNNDFRRAATNFWEITRQMIEEDRPDIVGHLDKIKMFNAHSCYFHENDNWYKDQVELTLDTIKKQGSIVEINTRGYYLYGKTDLYPSAWIIKRLADKKIPVIISSDAHQPDEITKGLSYTAKMLKKAGISKVSVLYDNAWNDYAFNEEGIIFN